MSAGDAAEPTGTEALAATLREGLGGSGEGVRRSLSLPEDAGDGAVARALVQVLGATSNATLELRPHAEGGSASLPVEPAAEPAVDTSFLGRLGATGPDGIDLASVREVKTLVALVRGGHRRQRHAALGRLDGLLAAGELAGEELRLVRRTLEELRDVSLGPALARAREKLPGGRGRAARAETERLQRTAQRFQDAIARFWEGEGPEPLGAASAEDAATLLLELTQHSGVIAAHVAAVLERSLGDGGDEGSAVRRSVLAQIRFAGDPRLVPALVRVLEGDAPGAVIDAARALSSLRDPRVSPALRSRYGRSVIAAERAALAGALGAHGVPTGREYVRGLLTGEEPDVLRAALEALEDLGGADDVDRVRDLLEHPDEGVAFHAVEALGRIGDGRALGPLAAVLDGGSTTALRAAVEDARHAIAAHLELRGEEAPESPALPLPERVTAVPPSTSAGARFRARRLYVFGWLYHFVGMRRRALRAFARAEELRPDWVGPPLAIGLVHARRSRHAQALAAFRRALAIDRRSVEAAHTTMPFVARAFL
ncbi:MAG: HEAT repeat domain-containing protein, partial [Myxococcota bacterium]